MLLSPLLCVLALADPIRLPVTRDATISNVGKEADFNGGGATRWKLKAIQEMVLFDLDVTVLQGRTIEKAELHLRSTGEPRMKRVGVGTLGAEFVEGTGSYSEVAGASTHKRRIHPDVHWTSDGGDLCRVILGQGGTFWHNADASPPDPQGWQTVAVDPRVISARVAGISGGFLATDDTGSEWTRDGETFQFTLYPNRTAYSREQNAASAPYVLVWPGVEDRQPPDAVTGLKQVPGTLPAGEAEIIWTTPADSGPAGTIGFFARFEGKDVPRDQIPLAGKPGEAVWMRLRDLKAAGTLEVVAVDAAGNRGRGASIRVTPSTHVVRTLQPATIQPFVGKENIPLPRVGGAEIAIIDELDKIEPRTGRMIPAQPAGYLRGNHLWDAATRTIRLHAAKGEAVAFQVVVHGPVEGLKARVDVAPLGGPRPEISVYETVPGPSGPLPDPLTNLPDAGLSVANSEWRSLHVEIYAPPSVPLNGWAAALRLTVNGETHSFPILLKVWPFEMPDRLGFLPEMNCYGLPEANEREYYRTAHRNRTVLNRVPYSQSGKVADGLAPSWDPLAQLYDWSAYDKRFGPYLDGSAFVDLPRKGVPLEVFYLPMHENWPTPIDPNYNGSLWADQAFANGYREAFVDASEAFARHVVEKKWDRTLFQGFLNNKVDFKKNGWSRGSSPWLLDEPASFPDYWALRYFGLAFHEGVNRVQPPPKNLVFRADISRPHWQREVFDGVLNYNVVGSALRAYRPMVLDRKERFGQMVLEYGGSNAIDGSNVQPAAWCVDAWCLGADGVIPWQTVGNANSWKKADELALFYPGRPGIDGKGDVLPSIRLKSYRRGQQDVEYLNLLAKSWNEPRWSVGETARRALGLEGRRESTGFRGAEDAGRISYGRLRPVDLWTLRMRVAEALSR